MVSVNGREAPDRDVLARMNEAITHRGPDSDGFFYEGPVAMAMRRLSIIDLEGGDQPIASEDGSVTVIQNGEIYNYRELADDLRRLGHEFATRSDTEVLAHLYEEHGLGFAERLRGMFAVAVWDRRRQRLVIARDRYGIKPLFYREKNGQLSFASELKSLRQQPDFSREVDLGALEAYLAMNFVPTPLTIYRDARKLPPGHLLIVENGDYRIEAYAQPRPVAADQVRQEGEEELAEELRSPPARLGLRSPGGRRSRRRPALGRDRLRHADRPRRRTGDGARQDVYDRFQGAGLERRRAGPHDGAHLRRRAS